MSARAMLIAMTAGSALVIGLARRPDPDPPPPTPVHHDEKPWLSREAAAQIIGADGTPGPLFASLTLGGSPPSDGDRARIAAFAHANGVDIKLDVAHGELAAIRFSVTYGGCCGYEGADVLALRLHRPSTGSCCVCGPATWVNDWAFVVDGVHGRARVRTNRVEVTWQAAPTVLQALARADELLGQSIGKARDAALDWRQLDDDRYLLELPLPWARPAYEASLERYDLGVGVRVQAGRIVEVSLALDTDTEEAALDAMDGRWGSSASDRDDARVWNKADRVITAAYPGPHTLITIRRRG